MKRIHEMLSNRYIDGVPEKLPSLHHHLLGSKQKKSRVFAFNEYIQQIVALVSLRDNEREKSGVLQVRSNDLHSETALTAQSNC